MKKRGSYRSISAFGLALLYLVVLVPVRFVHSHQLVKPGTEIIAAGNSSDGMLTPSQKDFADCEVCSHHYSAHLDNSFTPFVLANDFLEETDTSLGESYYFIFRETIANRGPPFGSLGFEV